MTRPALPECEICMGRKRIAVGLSFPPRKTIGFKVEYDPCPGCTPPPHTFHANRQAQILMETRGHRGNSARREAPE